MSANRDRPAAREAIEGLKVHQLRRENAVIFDEIKNLRNDVSARQADVDNIHASVQELKQSSIQANMVPNGFHDKLIGLDNKLEMAITDIQSLRSNLEQVNRTLLQLGERFEVIENQHVYALQSLTEKVTSKVSKNALDEIHERVDEVIDYLQAKRQNEDSLSRITETVAHESRAGSEQPCMSESFFYEEHFPPTDQQKRSEDAIFEPEDFDGENEDISAVEQNASPPSPTFEDVPTSLDEPLAQAIDNATRQHKIGNMQPTTSERVQHSGFLAEDFHDANLLSAQTCLIEADSRNQLDSIDAQNEERFIHRLPGPLKSLLNLKQSPEQNLLGYFDALMCILPKCKDSSQLVRIHLDRFVVGMREESEQRFVRRWLQENSKSLQNIRDAVLLLSKWPIVSTPTKQLATAGANHDVHSQASDSTIRPEEPRTHDVEQHTNTEGYGVTDKRRRQGSRPIDTDKGRPNVTTRAAAASQKDKKIEEQQSNATADTGTNLNIRKQTKASTQEAVASKNRTNQNKRTQRGKKRSRSFAENESFDKPRIPKLQEPYRDSNQMSRKRARVLPPKEDTNEAYPSSPPVIAQVPQSSLFRQPSSPRSVPPPQMRSKSAKWTHLPEETGIGAPNQALPK